MQEKSMSKLFTSAKQDRQIGLDFQSGGVAVVQVKSGKKQRGEILNSEFLSSVGQQAQALQNWVADKRAKNPLVYACLPIIITMFTRSTNRKSKKLSSGRIDKLKYPPEGE